MICHVGNRPVLKVGDHQVAIYDTAWIETALHRATVAADRDDFPFINDIRDGIVHYLENKCPLRLLPIEDLYSRMKKMLDRIGCPAIAENLTILTPPIFLSLARTARLFPKGFELGFFQQIRDEVQKLHQLGTEEVHFTEIREATLLLSGTKTWTPKCDEIQADIEVFLEQTAQLNSTPSSQLLVTLESA